MRRVLAAALLVALPATAQELRVTEAWVAEPAPGARVHAAYLTVANPGDAPAAIVGAEAEGHAAAHLHRSDDVDGVATMTPVARIEVPPGGAIEMRPGGLHIMMMGPKAPLAAGDMVSLTLMLEGGSELAAEVEVRAWGHDGGVDHADHATH